MSQSYDAIVSRLFGDEQQPQSLLLPDDAVNTTESIGNALDRATPSGVGESLRGELAEREFLRGVFDDDRSLSGGDLSAPGVESAALRASFMLNNAGRYSRDDILKSWGYSQKLNMSLSMTLDNRDTAARIASEIVPEDVKTFAPRLLRRIQNYEDSALIWRHDMQAANAFAMAFDNPLGLGEAERDVVGRGGMMAEDPASAGAGLSRGLRSGLAQTAGAAADAGREAFRDILGSVLFTGEVADEEGNIYQSGVPVLSGDWTTAAMNFFGDAARQAYQDARDIRAEAPEWLQQRLWDHPELLREPAYLAENIANVGVSFLPIIGAYVAAGPAGVAFAGHAMEASQFYDELLKDNVPEDMAHTYSTAFGLVSGVFLERYGFDAAMGSGPVKNLFKRMMAEAAEKGIASRAKYGAARAATGFLGEGSTEWLQNVTQAAFEASAKKMTTSEAVAHVENAMLEVENFLFGGIMGGGISGAHSRAEVRSERGRQELAGLRDALRRAMDGAVAENARREVTDLAREATMSEDRQAFAQSLEQAVAAADTSTTRAENPQAFEEETRHLIPEDARTVWLDVDTVLDFAAGKLVQPEHAGTDDTAPAPQDTAPAPTQELNQSAALDLTEGQQDANLERLGVTREALNNALAAGARAVEVDTAAVISRFDGAERQALLDAVRREPDGMTAHEARAFDPRARAAEAAQRISEARKDEGNIRTEATRIRQSYVRNGFAPHLAEYYTTLHVEQAKAFADRYGLDAAKLLQQRRIVRERAEADARAGQLLQLNPDVDPDESIPIVDLTGTKPVKITPQEAKSFVQKWKGAPLEITTDANGKWKITLSRKDASHPFWSSDKEKRHDVTRRAALAELERVLAGARRIEDIPPRHAGVDRTIRFYTPVMRSGGNPVALRIVVHEVAGKQAEIDGVELYDIIRERPSQGTALPSGSRGKNMASDVPREITIREMLSGVNDSEGNSYFEQAPLVLPFTGQDVLTGKQAADEGGNPLVRNPLDWSQYGALQRLYNINDPGSIAERTRELLGGKTTEQLREAIEKAIAAHPELRGAWALWRRGGSPEQFIARNIFNIYTEGGGTDPASLLGGQFKEHVTPELKAILEALGYDGIKMNDPNGPRVPSQPDEPAGRVYVYRGSNSAESPDNGSGFTMWATGGWTRVSHYGGEDLSRMWRLDVTDAPDIQDLIPEIAAALKEDFLDYELTPGAEDSLLAVANTMDEENRNLTADELREDEALLDRVVEKIAENFDPEDIVDHAGSFDDPEIMQWSWGRFFEPRDIKTIRTRDGAISFDLEAGENLGEYEGDDDRILYQPAFQGSPTRGIKRMSTEYIGTGEGAHVYGWGLYFAEMRAVAEWYRKRLADTVRASVNGRVYVYDGETWARESDVMGKKTSFYPLAWEKPEHHALTAMEVSGGNVEEAVKLLEKNKEIDASDKKEKAVFDKAIKMVQDGKVSLLEKGQLYEVDIPENDELLDYDKPLSEQPENIKKLLKGVKKLLPENALEDLDGDWNLLFGEDNTGQEFYDTLSSLVGGDKAASLLLNKAGIPGLRYLDADSRGKMDGSRNFVIWNDKAVKALRTFYQSLESNPDAVGAITPEIAARTGLRPGVLALTEKALAHIEESHGEQIRKLGYSDAREFVNYALSNVDAVYPGNTNRTFDFVAARGNDLNKRVLTRIEFAEEGDIYEIKTAGPARSDFYDKKIPLWERAQTNRSQPGESGAASTTDEANSQKNEAPGASAWNTSGDTGQSGNALNLTTALEQVKRQGRGPRGRVAFKPDGSSVTSLFASSDLSTPIHEGAHVFINDLIRVVMDNGAAAEQLFIRDMAEVTGNLDLDENMSRRRQDALQKRLAKHRAGIIQARKDLITLVENANAQREAHGKATGLTLEQVPLEAALNGALTEEQMRTLQEVNAAAFEDYIKTGSAPSEELKGVFARMKEWLKKIYRAAKTMGVKIPDDVARVFDRMLATDRAIESSRFRDAHGSEDAMFEAIEGLDPEEYAALQELRNRAEAEVSAALDAKTQKDRDKRYAQYMKEGRALADNDPLWTVIAALTVRKDNPFSGVSRESLVRQYGEAFVRDLTKTHYGKKIISREGGTPLDAVGINDILGGMAASMGFDDAHVLFDYLYDNIVANHRTKGGDAAKYADARLAEDDRLAEDELLEGGAPGEDYVKYLDEVEAVALRMAARQASAWRTPEQQARWVEKNRLPRERIARQVREELRKLPLSKIRLGNYSAELSRALQERNAALVEGHAMDALRAVDRARVALEGWREAKKILDARQRFEKLAQRLAKLKRGVVPDDAWNAVQDTLERFRLAPPRRRGESRPLADVIAELAGQSEASDFSPDVPPWLLNGGERNYRDLTMPELEDVEHLLSALEYMGRNAVASNRDSEAAMAKAVADAGAQAMSGLKTAELAEANSRRRRIQGWWSGFLAGSNALQWQMREADGFQNTGPDGTRGVNETEIYGKIIEGESGQTARYEELSDRLAPEFARLAESAKAWEKKYGTALRIVGRDGRPVEVPEVMRRNGQSNWTPDNVIALALNLGNSGNIERVLAGYPDLKAETVAQLLGDDVAKKLFPDFRPPAGQRSDGLLSAPDWRAVQEIWNIIGSQWKDIQKTHERMFGFKPRGVEAEPFAITVGGRVVRLDGGYYPVIYDPELSARVGQYTERDDILARTDAIYAVPAARRGFTKARADGATGHPVMLRTSVVPRHLRDVTRFIELAEIVRFADRVINSENWKEGYVRAFGTERYRALRPNLKGVVLEENPPREAIGQLAEKLRKPLVFWGLSWNLKTALLQSTALFPAMNDLGAANVLHGLKTLAVGRYGLVKQVWEMSPYMKNRAKNIDQDLRKAVGGIDAKTREKVVKLLGKELTWEKVVDAGMLPLLSVDMATSCAIWIAGYNREMSRLMGEKAGKRGIDPTNQYHRAAALAADMAVKAVNPDYNPSSRSAFLRDKKGVTRLLNMFASAVVLFAQRRAYSAQALKHGKMSLGEYARYEAYDFMLPGIAMGLLLALARGEDEEEGAKEIAKSVLGTAAMRVPVGGSMIENIITGESWQRGASTVFDQPYMFGSRLRSAGDDPEKWAWALADIMSFMLRVPVSRVTRNAIKGYDQWERGEGTPLSVVMPRPGK